jgi:hypothetical protein
MEVNAEETESIFMSYQQHTGQNHNIRIANQSSENVTRLKYFGRELTYETCNHEEICSRLISGNACYSAVYGF